MSPLTIASIVFVCVFASGLLGLYLRSSLPEHHLSEGSMDVVKLGAGLIATLAALVLGLLTASAQSSFDRINDEFTRTATNVVILDRSLARYGPETKEVRELLRLAYASAIDAIFSREGNGLVKLDAPDKVTRLEKFQDAIRELAPQDEAQRSLQSQALTLSGDLAQVRWLLIEQGRGSISTPLLAALVLWLAIIFAGFGLGGSRNPTVVATLVVCALSVAGSIFLIEEMNRPLEGLMQISSAPARNALKVI